MSTQPNDGGPAFPSPPVEEATDRRAYHRDGMTLRDYFAASALTSMTIAPDYCKGPCNATMAERAYLIADHMLAERAKTNPPAGQI